MNTVLVTSAIYTNYGIYDRAERINQTLATVQSARKYIPNATIILIDNSKVDVQNDESAEFEALLDAVDYYIDNSDDTDIQYFHNNVSNYDIGKNAMECIGMVKSLKYINSDDDLRSIIENSSRVYKLSGRYTVTDQFDTANFDNSKTQGKYVFKQRQPGWIKDVGVDTLLQTRLWSFHPTQLSNTIDLFNTIIENMFATFNQNKYIDIEHSMSKFILPDQLVEVATVGLVGNIAPNGAPIAD
jgi:hypothetical protein